MKLLPLLFVIPFCIYGACDRPSQGPAGPTGPTGPQGPDGAIVTAYAHFHSDSRQFEIDTEGEIVRLLDIACEKSGNFTISNASSLDGAYGAVIPLDGVYFLNYTVTTNGTNTSVGLFNGTTVIPGSVSSTGGGGLPVQNRPLLGRAIATLSAGDVIYIRSTRGLTSFDTVLNVTSLITPNAVSLLILRLSD